MSMGVECGVNPASGTVGAELHVQSETVIYCRPPPPQTVDYHREPPPAYTESASAPVVVVNQPSVQRTTSTIVQTPLGKHPALYICPQCNERVVTKVKYVASQKTHVVAGFTCGLFCWCFLCCLAAIPYMTTAFKKAEHYCPNCKLYLGRS